MHHPLGHRILEEAHEAEFSARGARHDPQMTYLNPYLEGHGPVLRPRRLGAVGVPKPTGLGGVLHVDFSLEKRGLPRGFLDATHIALLDLVWGERLPQKALALLLDVGFRPKRRA